MLWPKSRSWCARPFSSQPMTSSAGYSNKRLSASTRVINPNLGRFTRAEKRSGCRGFLAVSRCSATTTITRAKNRALYPADAALGLEVGYTPALAKLLCLEGADETTYLKAERHLEQTGG